MSNGFCATDSTKVSLKGNVYDFLVDYKVIDKFDILNIHKYLMVKNSTKKCSSLLNKCISCITKF